MGRHFGRIWALTAAGFVATYGGMSCLRVLGLDLFDPQDGRAFTLLLDGVFWVFGGLMTGLVNAALTVSWIEPSIPRRYRSSSLAVGLAAGLLGIYAADLLGWLEGLSAVVGFIVIVQIIDALPSRVLRGVTAILLVLGVQMFFRSQAYKILRARQTVYFVETNLARMKARGEGLPKDINALEARLARYAKLHGIRSLRTDPWRYDYFYAVGNNGGHAYLTWGADGLPGPSPAIDPGTPGADIDSRAAGIARGDQALSPYQIRITPVGPSTGKD